MRLLCDRIGLRVIVKLLDGTAAEGVIEKRRSWRMGKLRGRMPGIRLDDGRLVWGYECFWGAAKPDPVGRWSVRGWSA